MKIPLHSAQRDDQTRSLRVVTRQEPGGLSHGTEGIIIFAVIVGFFLCGGLVLGFVLRFLRTRHANPTYLPGKWLKAKWRAWVPSSEKKRYSSSLQDRRSIQMARTPSPSISNMLAGSRGPSRNGESSGDVGVPDRNTSVRSTITLPAYSAAARPTEQVMGREGERAGIDTVVEFPETVDEEEARREDEMETLYQIRRARREERSVREERRQLRREARARGDTTTLAELRREEMAEADRPSAALIQDHQTRDRGRRISTVQYLDLGLARHDGSRVRANSNDSDRSLLGAAAAMGRVIDTRSRSDSGTMGALLGNHAAPSLRFNTADYSDDDAASDLEPPTLNRRSRTPSLSRLGGPPSINTDVLPEPPSYDQLSARGREGPADLPRQPEPIARLSPVPQGEAPPYESPILGSGAGAPRLAPYAPLPSIEITPTPWTPTLDG